MSVDDENLTERVRRRRERGEDSRDTARELLAALHGFAEAPRRAQVRGVLSTLLQQEHAYGVTLFLLEGLTDPEHLLEIAERILPLPELQSDDEESHLADLMRILSAAGASGHLVPVSAYLLERPIGVHWQSVPWALWPRRKSLFSRAWCRYFLECDEDSCASGATLRPFLAESAAVRVVRQRLLAVGPPGVERWDLVGRSLREHAERVPWLTEVRRAALHRTLR